MRNQHSLSSHRVEFEIRVVFFEEPLQELRFAQMKLIEWVVLAAIVKLSMKIKAVGGPVSVVNPRLPIDALG